MPAWAHSANRNGDWQPLDVHLRNVAALAREFGTPLRIGDQSYWAGLLHDLGKLDEAFQRRLNDPAIHAPHAAYGACVAADARAYEVAFAVAAHHAGLRDRSVIAALPQENPPNYPTGPTYQTRARALLDRARATLPELRGAPPATSGGAGASELEALELRTRLVFSCLVDADRLDTEQFYAPEQSAERHGQVASMMVLAERVEHHLDALQVAAQPGPVNAVRAEVLAACRAAAAAAPTMATLTVPTGGGKTLSSLLYALRHAAVNGLRRVIVVVPFLAIIEQNAAVLRAALGERGDDETPIVLEHHSGLIVDHDAGHTARDPDAEPQGGHAIWRRLAAENWDAPVVITTAVQFLESLFTNHPSRARKLHRVCKAVVVFDEVQTLPPGLLQPILRMLQQFHREYGTSFLFCTATQPAFEESHPGTGDRWVAHTLTEVAPDPPSLFNRLRRVRVRWPAVEERIDWPALAERLVAEERALAIVNTKAQAAALFAAVREAAPDPDAVVHLSARLCPAHRRVVLDRVRERLRARAPCVVCATQLVEAGVDLDFPAVYRAFGPLDAIAQAAGRCNREGRLPTLGSVVVFRPLQGGLPRGTYATATDVTAALLQTHGGELDLDDPGLYRRYFDLLYTVTPLDRRDVAPLRQVLNFQAVADAVHIIDEDTQGVVVPFGSAANHLAQVRRGEEVTRGLLRRLQPFSITLYRREFERALAGGAIEALVDDTLYVARPGSYDAELGFSVSGDAADYIV
jgi:CRISPR-associated endonuclease/helicase Cas3